MNITKKLIYFLLGAFLTIVIAIATLFFVATQKTPLIVETSQTSPDALLKSKQDLKQVLAELGSDNSQKKITLTHKQMEQLASILSKSVTPLSARYNYAGLDVVTAASLKLPEKYSGRYINISSDFPDNNNLLQGETHIGNLPLSNALFLKLISLAVSVVLDEDFSRLLNEAAVNTRFDAEKIYIQLDLQLTSEQFKSRLKNYFQNYRRAQGKDSDYSGSLEYYDFLTEIGSYIAGMRQISLVDILQPLFQKVQQRSAASDPQLENRNALIALALFAGDAKMRSFLSRVIGVYPKSVSGLPRFVIADREDLVLHFIYSAIIQLMSSEGISVSIGELKEISDMSKGGSGFSFTDLAADRAGTRFAIYATAQPAQALKLQKKMAAVEAESDFFPDISILPENLTQQAFEREYKNTRSIEFKTVVREIDRRINQLPLYR